jgi:hypothetical protein
MTTPADGVWMKRAFKNAGKGLFHKQLGIPKSEKIPMTWLQVIVNTPLEKVAHNPTKVGDKTIKVTHLVKYRANALLNADRGKK